MVHALGTDTALRRRTGGATPRPHGRRSRRTPLSGFSFAALPRPAVLGVLNVTPDSFSDGGRFLEPRSAIARARELVAEGADVIDVGGESTRPGAAPVAESLELRRVLPVVVKIAATHPCLPISIDTTKSEVARRAIAAGAAIVNDVSGATADREMLRAVAESDAAVILMHRKGTPATMKRLARYEDVVSEVKRFLAERIEAAIAAGIREEAIAIDPGIGFAKNLSHNLRLLARLDEIVALGFPVVVGVSRKSFLGRLLDTTATDRVEGTLAASLIAIAGGAAMVRVHDVAAMKRAARVAGAIWKERQ